MQCRHCRATLSHIFVDLGVQPVSNAFLSADQLNKMEPFYPLRAYVCDTCLLVQLESFEAPQNIFNDHYAYFSSYSNTWVEHARQYVEQIVPRLGLNDKSFVVEIASNDGYLLQFFKCKGIPNLGIEPAANAVDAAKNNHGIESWPVFFNKATARQLVRLRGKADLVVCNNVLAHVPDLNDFVGSLKIILADDGVVTLEFPHLLSLIRGNQFDTIYHEHYSYFSLLAVIQIFEDRGLYIFDVDHLSTHGGSLRIYATRINSDRMPSVSKLLEEELNAGLDIVSGYSKFAEQVKETKRNLLSFLIIAKRAGKTITGYGAPAKGNTLLNYCGVGTDFIDYTVDTTPHKQGMFLPGTHIPIFAPSKIMETKPDYVLILPWNWRDEIVSKMSGISEWGGKFVVPIPQVGVSD